MTSARVEGAAKGAQIGGTVGGPIGSGVGAILGGIFGGGGSYAVANGYEVTGQLSHRGFDGTVVGLASNAGERYRDPATGEQHWLGEVGKVLWTESGLDASDPAIPFSFTIPYNFQLAFDEQKRVIQEAGNLKKSASSSVLEAIRESIGGGPADLGHSAPLMNVAAPAGAPTPSSMQPASILPAQSQQSGSSVLPILALLFGAAYVMR